METLHRGSSIHALEKYNGILKGGIRNVSVSKFRVNIFFSRNMVAAFTELTLVG